MQFVPPIALALALALVTLIHARAEPLTDIFTQDVTRFTRLLTFPTPEERIEGIQGLSHLKHWPSERAILKLLDDRSSDVRREAVVALCRIGTALSVPSLARAFDDSSWEIRGHAHIGLEQMTAQQFPMQSGPWLEWWTRTSPEQLELDLLTRAQTATTTRERSTALRALRHLASPKAEPQLLSLLELQSPNSFTPGERSYIAETLERIGTSRSITALSTLRNDSAAWALGRIGGPEAERALLTFPKSLPVLLNLDRLGSTNCAAILGQLIYSFGLVTYRSQPDDLHLPESQPIQRVAANLIRRSGQAPLLVDLVLRELELTMSPPISHASEIVPPSELRPLLEKMREELKPGFVRGDGLTTSQPLTALYHVAADRCLAPRLIPLLRHPAYVPRIYIAMLLGKLGATEAFPEIRAIIREGYPFSDSTALASGKHFDQSQTVRWRGFLCMALGKMGGVQARLELESLAADPHQPRDIRYGSVIGLQFIGSPNSIPVLRQIASNDIIWMVRETAADTAAEIALLHRQLAE